MWPSKIYIGSSLDSNYANPNPLAQTLRIFLARFLRLFPRFEWLG
jgi:hypothetical protein